MMKTIIDKSPESQPQTAIRATTQRREDSDVNYAFVDNREETASMRQLQVVADNSLRVQGLTQLKAMMNNSPRSAAMKKDSDDMSVQRIEEGEILQGKVDVESAAQLAQQSEARPNNTGLPDNLKAGVESLSGLSLDNVKVHYNSSQPAQLNAHAYAQGTDIHVGPGQEQHLPHETWHVVQQMQGRVKPTTQAKGFAINDNESLETEADQMGARALSNASLKSRLPSAQESSQSAQYLGQQFDTTQRLNSGALVRQFVCGMGSPPSLDDVITKGTKSKPSDIADQIESGSESFKALRGRADKEVADTFGKGRRVTYNDKPKEGGGTGPAYYKDGDTFYDKGAPLPQTVLNVIFETANAAQAGLFKKVESDFDDGTLMDKELSAYIDDPSELGSLQDDYDSPASKRSLIQEYYEWNSCQIAKDSLLDIAPKYIEGGDVASITWESSFGAILECKSFEQYYKLAGKTHRGAVQATLMPKVKTKEKGGQVSIEGLF